MPLGQTSGCAPATPIRHPSGSSCSRITHSASKASFSRAEMEANSGEVISTTHDPDSYPHATVASLELPSRVTWIVCGLWIIRSSSQATICVGRERSVESCLVHMRTIAPSQGAKCPYGHRVDESSAKVDNFKKDLQNK